MRVIELLRTSSGVSTRLVKESGGKIPVVKLKVFKKFLKDNGYYGPVRWNGDHQFWVNKNPPWRDFRGYPSKTISFAAADGQKEIHPHSIGEFVKYYMQGFELNDVLKLLGAR